MEKAGGYMGKLLRIDLGAGQVTEEKLSDEVAEKYVGGTGMGIKYLYDELPPGVAWNDPGNRLIFFSGPLGATRISGTGTFSVITKGTHLRLGNERRFLRGRVRRVAAREEL